MDRLSQMSIAAARMALDDAGIQIGPHNRDRVGVVLGTCFGSTDVAAQFAKVIFTEQPAARQPHPGAQHRDERAGRAHGHRAGGPGANTTVNHREVSGEAALAYAASQIARGRADAILAGGIVSEFQFNVLSRFRSLSPVDGGTEGGRPFDARRNGFVVGEGAGVLCLESLESAEARGAVPYCEVAGWGLSSAPCAPNDWPTDPTGPALAISRALSMARVDPGAIDLVSAAANGGLRSDPPEAAALGKGLLRPGRPAPGQRPGKARWARGFPPAGCARPPWRCASGSAPCPPPSASTSRLRP